MIAPINPNIEIKLYSMLLNSNPPIPNAPNTPKQIHAIKKKRLFHAKKEEPSMQITGAELFVKALLAEQVDTLFAYPGG